MHVLERYNCDVDELCLLSASVDHFCRRSFLFPSETCECIAFSVFVAFLALPLAQFRLFCCSFLMIIEASLTIQQVRVQNE